MENKKINIGDRVMVNKSYTSIMFKPGDIVTIEAVGSLLIRGKSNGVTGSLMRHEFEPIETGKQLRDKGIKQAVDNANNKVDYWSATAYGFLIKYIREHSKFMAEDVRQAAAGIVPEPPSLRAWGSIMVRAAKAGLIKRNGFKSVKNPKAHKTPATVWIVNERKEWL